MISFELIHGMVCKSLVKQVPGESSIPAIGEGQDRTAHIVGAVQRRVPGAQSSTLFQEKTTLDMDTKDHTDTLYVDTSPGPISDRRRLQPKVSSGAVEGKGRQALGTRSESREKEEGKEKDEVNI